MNLVELYELQKDLDDIVASKVRKDYDVNSHYALEDIVFAFHTEVFELANELSFFKYWKQSHQVDKIDTLEELVDCIHFLLTIGIKRKYTRVIKEIQPEEYFIESSFIELFNMLRSNTIDNMLAYKTVFTILLSVATKIGFTNGEIETAYKLKHMKNIQRQQDNY